MRTVFSDMPQIANKAEGLDAALEDKIGIVIVEIEFSIATDHPMLSRQEIEVYLLEKMFRLQGGRIFNSAQDEWP